MTTIMSMKRKIMRPEGFEMTYNSGEDHQNWKGGRITRKDGYILITTLLDEMFGGDQQTLEHRYVMAKKIGRKLTRNEHVHHINGDRSDNRIENLRILSMHEHARHHGEEKRGTHIKVKERFCSLCTNGFYPSQGYNGSSQKFCSRSCHAKWQWKNKPIHKGTRIKDNIIPRFCKQCDKSFIAPGNWSKQKFCSISCGITHRNLSINDKI